MLKARGIYGNLYSSDYQDKRKELELEEVIFLPGVGSFPFAMDNLKKLQLDKFLISCFGKSNKKIIGICLGMQIFFDFSEEGNRNGLKIIPGFGIVGGAIGLEEALYRRKGRKTRGQTTGQKVIGGGGRTKLLKEHADLIYGTLEGSVTLNNGIQEWTIPSSGTYTIKAFGAQGGTQTSFSYSTHGGGRGAIIQGDFSLSAGNVLKILVGQQPIDVAWLNGGGGGTFVIKN